MDYDRFCREMYRDNCMERKLFGETLYKDFDEYMSVNNNFLLDLFGKLGYTETIVKERN
jgi:hypothetical protein